MIKKYFRILIKEIYYLLILLPKINILNKRIAKNNKNNIIPIIIDCELSTLNQYLEPVVEELLKLNYCKFEFYFGEIIKGAGSSYSGYNKNNIFSVKLYKYLKGDMIFLSPHIYPKGPLSALKIIFDHAICSAKFSHHPIEYYLNYNIYCITGKLYEEKIKNILNNFSINNLKLRNVGYPKSDKLFNNKTLSRNNILSKLNLDPNKKNILYAPSWEEGLSAREFGLQLTEIILNNKDINLIIKFHPCFFVSKIDKNYQFYTGNINWDLIFSKFNKYSNYKFIKDFKIDDLLFISDIMITDLSSVALEFLALEKPVIYLDCPKFETTFSSLYKSYNDLSYSELLLDPKSNAGRHVGHVNYDYNTINDDINFIINNPDYKINERKEYSELLLSNKGISSKTCADMIVEEFNNYIIKKNN